MTKKKKCVICKGRIPKKRLEGKSVTCNQSCAGKLAWQTMGK